MRNLPRLRRGYRKSNILLQSFRSVEDQHSERTSSGGAHASVRKQMVVIIDIRNYCAKGAPYSGVGKTSDSYTEMTK